MQFLWYIQLSRIAVVDGVATMRIELSSGLTIVGREVRRISRS